MITPKQEKWLSHLSTTNKISVTPFDPNTKKIFLKIKNKLIKILGKQISVVHRGATSMGISGQGDVDCYIPVIPTQFFEVIEKIKPLLGEPDSLYPNERARFNTYIDNTKVEVFVINCEHESWINSEKFESYLKSHKDYLERYKLLKENSAGLSTQQYYRNKTEFINEILELVNQN